MQRCKKQYPQKGGKGACRYYILMFSKDNVVYLICMWFPPIFRAPWESRISRCLIVVSVKSTEWRPRHSWLSWERTATCSDADRQNLNLEPIFIISSFENQWICTKEEHDLTWEEEGKDNLVSKQHCRKTRIV